MSGPAVANPKFDFGGAGVSAVICGSRVKSADADEGSWGKKKAGQERSENEAHNECGVEVSGRLYLHKYVLPSSYKWIGLLNLSPI